MEIGWFVLFLFLIAEVLMVMLLCMPMPSNDARHLITSWVTSLWEAKPIKYTVFAVLAMNVGYFWMVCDALLHPFYDFGIINPGINMGVSCEYKRDLFYSERNAYITGSNIVLFFVLRRLVDIQDKLHTARQVAKGIEAGGGGDGGGASEKQLKKVN